MKLHTQTLPQVRQLLRQGGWFGPALLFAVLALEFFGRQSTTDVYDTAGAAVLVLLIALVSIRHRAAPLAWVGYLGRQMGKLVHAVDHFKIEFGPDLRGMPPIPRRFPISVHLTIGLLAIWSIAALTLWSFLPASWRSYAVQGSYTLYLLGMIGLWGLLFAGALGGIYFPFMLFNYLVPRSGGGPDESKMSRGQLLFLAVYSTVIYTAWRLLPLWIVPACCGAAIVVASGIALWPHRADVQFIWRADGSRRVWSITTAHLLWTTTTVITLLLTAILLTAAGGVVLGHLETGFDMPVTVTLGGLVGWLTPGILISAGAFIFLLWKQNPSRPCRRSLHVGGNLAAAASPAVARIVQRWGWNVSFDPQPADEVDVCVQLVESRHSQAKEFEPDWPLRVSLEDLKDGAVRERLERRDEIQKRRLLLRGLARIFKHAKGKHFAGGSGYWLAPHLWCMLGLVRDEMDEDRDDPAFMAQTIGPPFREVMHRHVREYFYRVLRALQVDLIFVEDGIDFRKLKKVIRQMFEIYDKSGGKRRAEEVQFQGLPKLRVLIHEFQLDEPFQSETYPEPRFQDLGRARILHIFRDRGEHEEYFEPPFDFSRTPEPLYV